MKNKNNYFIKIAFLIILTTIAQANEPKQWGENVSGVAIKFNTYKKEVALTLDACGVTAKSSQFDEKLINFLTQNNIKATLFLNLRWIKSNPEVFKKLQNNKLFELANHGTNHRPLSINGKSIYGQNGTKSKDEVLFEIEENNRLFQSLNQKKPLFFRSGTAYYDELAVEVARKELKMEIAGFSIIADAGATLVEDEVSNRVSNAKNGDIIIAHMNHPESGTADGLRDGIVNLLKKGFKFVQLSDVKKQLIYVK